MSKNEHITPTIKELYHRLIIKFTPKPKGLNDIEKSSIDMIEKLMESKDIAILQSLNDHRIYAVENIEPSFREALEANYKAFQKANNIKGRPKNWKEKIKSIELQILKEKYAQRVDLPFEIKTSKARRKEANIEVHKILENGGRGKDGALEFDDLGILSWYTGDGKTEFYTPPELAQATWDLLGVKDGDRVLDPSSGTGIFSRTTPKFVNIDSVEISKTSAKINGLLNPHTNVNTMPFEEFATKNPNNKYDSIITNVPFGQREKDFATMDKDYQHVKDNGEYFILRSLDMLKENGRAVFICAVSTAQRKGNDYAKARLEMVKKASFVGGYRLPSIMFSETGTDVVTDILVFEKHPNKTYNQLKEKDYQLDSFRDAIQISHENKDFIDGKYFDKREKNILGKFQSKEDAIEEAMKKGEVIHHQVQKDTVVTDLELPELKKSLKKRLSPSTLKNTFGYSELVSLQAHTQSEQELKIIEDIQKRVLNEELAVREGQGLNEKEFLKLTKEAEDKYIKLSSIFIVKKIAIENKIDGDFQPFLDLMGIIFDPLQSVEFIEEYVKNNKWLVDAITEEKYLKKLRKSFTDYGIRTGYDRLLLYLNGEGDELKSLMEENPLYGVVGEIKNGVRVYPIESFSEDRLKSDNVAITEDGIVSIEDFYKTFNSTSYENALLQIMNQEKPNDISDSIWQHKQESLINGLDDFKFKKSIDNLHFSIDTLRLYLDEDDRSSFVDELIRISGDDLAKAMKEKSLQILKKNRDVASKIGVTLENINSISDYGYRSIFRIILKSRVLEKADLRQLSKYLRIESTVEVKVKEVADFIRGVYLTSFSEVTQLLNYTIKEVWINDVGYKAKLEDALDKNSVIKTPIITSVDNGMPFEELRGDISDELIQMAHVHQNEDARHFSTSLSGTIAQGTGLGKSITMLMTSIASLKNGSSKRVMVLTPNGVLSKLENEFRRFVTDKWQDRILVMSTQTLTQDMAKLRKGNKIRLIIAPHSIIDSFALKRDTVDGLARLSDGVSPTTFYQLVKEYPTFDRAKAFFENTKVDTLLIDEQQNFKNGVSSIGLRKASHTPSGSHTTLLYISEYIRQQRGSNGGVMSVTATPLTNNPSEIINNFVLSGSYKDRYGNIKSGFKSQKDFVGRFIKQDILITPKVNGYGFTESKTFVGFSDFKTLKDNFDDGVKVRTAESEQAKSGGKLKVKPKSELLSSNVVPTKEILETFSDLSWMNEKYKLSIMEKTVLSNMDDSQDKYDLTRSLQRTIGETFGFISRVKALSNGKSFAYGYTPIVVKDGTTEEDLLKSIGKMKFFNFLLFKDKDVLTFKELEELDLRREAMEHAEENINKIAPEFLEKREDGTLIFNAYTTDDESIRKIINKLVKDKICDENKLFITDDFPKYKLMMTNISNEYERKETSRQIVFSDKPVLTQRVISQIIRDGVDDKILPQLTVHTFNKSGGLKTDKSNAMELQNNFNDSLTPDIMVYGIAGITGVDFNNNVSAVHLMNIPNTPDIHEQAMGRGVRQGNTISSVNVYKYFMDGTFDEFMDKLVAGKSDWIGQLMGDGEVDDEVLINTSSSEQIIANAVQMFGDEKISQVEMVEKYMAFQVEEQKKEQKYINSIQIKMQVSKFADLEDMKRQITRGRDNYFEREKANLFKNAKGFSFRKVYLRVPIRFNGYSGVGYSIKPNFLKDSLDFTLDNEVKRLADTFRKDREKLEELQELRESRKKLQAKLKSKKLDEKTRKSLTDSLSTMDFRRAYLASPTRIEYGEFDSVDLGYALAMIMKDRGETYKRDVTTEDEIYKALQDTIKEEFKKVEKQVANLESRIDNIDTIIIKAKNELLALRGDDTYDGDATVEYGHETITIAEFLDILSSKNR